MEKLNTTDFRSLARREKNAQKRIRLLALAHFSEGHNRIEITSILKVSRTSVNKWVSDFLTDGLAGLEHKTSPGRPPSLNKTQSKQLATFIEQQSLSEEGGRLSGADINEYIFQHFGINYEPSSVYRVLKRLGFSWITSRSKHPKQSQKAQEAFKNFRLETILNIPGHIALAQVDVWFQDEARIGQQNTTTRLWAKKGSRPRVVRQQQFEYAYVFGAVCPSNGNTEALITPWVDKRFMRQHLKLISEATLPDRHAVVIMDGAGWHTKDLDDEFDNLTMIKLPPYSPELNPIEQVWGWMRQRHLANRCFANYEDIVEQCTQAWNSFISDIDTVKNLCNRSWINLTR
ncbi:IS630 family transposase [Shewanella sp. MTB7]|uniref:IS630 family transposase n=2 Tax=unclassified Shewanella TaxID=196818 RepID=UPI003FA6D3E8